MSIYQRGKSWYYDFRCKGQRKVGCIGPVSKTMAKEFEARLRANVLQGFLGLKNEKAKDPNFEDFAAEFLKNYQLTHRTSSGQSCASHVKHYKTCFGRKRLSEIAPKDIEKFKGDMLAEGKAPASVNRYLVVLFQMFSTAILWGQTTKNPAHEVELLRVRNARTRFLSDTEGGRLLEECGPGLRPVVITAIHTGMRRSEITRLTWADIDFQRGVIRVCPEHAKSGEAREIPMDRTVGILLASLKPAIIAPSAPYFGRAGDERIAMSERFSGMRLDGRVWVTYASMTSDTPLRVV